MYNSEQLFIFILVASLVYDFASKPTRECIKYNKARYSIIIVTVFHHIIDIFGHFGWLLWNPVLLKLYLIIPIIIIYYWSTTGGRCHVTTYVNEQCGWSKDEYFNDIFKIIGFKKYDAWNDIYQNYFLIVGAIISLTKLWLF
jgi:hypothetical protein